MAELSKLTRRLTVRVIPRASCDKVVGMYGESLKVKLCAPPVDGAANKALEILLAEYFHKKRSEIRIIRGKNSRIKTVEIIGGE